LPTTGIDVSAQRERVPSIQTIPGLPRERWAYDGGLSLSYEVDLFGRVRRGIEAARGDARQRKPMPTPCGSRSLPTPCAPIST
jgi:outer membrane protein TolC